MGVPLLEVYHIHRFLLLACAAPKYETTSHFRLWKYGIIWVIQPLINHGYGFDNVSSPYIYTHPTHVRERPELTGGGDQKSCQTDT